MVALLEARERGEGKNMFCKTNYDFPYSRYSINVCFP